MLLIQSGLVEDRVVAAVIMEVVMGDWERPVKDMPVRVVNRQDMLVAAVVRVQPVMRNLGAMVYKLI
jgi:hypothetical protein